jgi:hypothetical protein
MPPSAEMLGMVPEDYDFAVVDRAAAWLAGFTRAISASQLMTTYKPPLAAAFTRGWRGAPGWE